MNDTIAEPTRLDAHLAQAQAALERAKAVARLAGDGARAWSRTGIYCETAAEENPECTLDVPCPSGESCVSNACY